jgi:hypothetical protein
MYDGTASLGMPLDLNNEVVRKNVIWYMQPFEYKSNTYNYVMSLVRYILGKVFHTKDWSTNVDINDKITVFFYGEKRRYRTKDEKIPRYLGRKIVKSKYSGLYYFDKV